MPEPPCTASPAGLFSTMTSASSNRIMSLSACSVLVAASESWPAPFGVSSLSGGMRMLCPSSIRSLLSARLPLTRSSPLRTMRWMWENDRPGKARLEKAVDAHVVLVGGDDDGLNLGRQRRRLGHDLLRLRHKRLCRTGRRSRKPRRWLAARTIRLRPLGCRAPIGPRALRAIARRAERFFDATAHGCCGSGVKRLRSAKAANRHGESGTNWLLISHLANTAQCSNWHPVELRRIGGESCGFQYVVGPCRRDQRRCAVRGARSGGHRRNTRRRMIWEPATCLWRVQLSS